MSPASASALKTDDPYRILHSQSLVDLLRDNNLADLCATSTDMEDLYYLLPHNELVESVKVCVTQHNDDMEFRLRSGLTVELFFLKSHTSSTVDGGRRGQGSISAEGGVYIRSAVAPILSDIFRSRVYRKIAEHLPGTAEHIFRYVDNYLLLVSKDNNQRVINVLKIFQENSCSLKFTTEFAQDKELQFLDIRLLFKLGHMFWCFSPRAKKPLLIDI